MMIIIIIIITSSGRWVSAREIYCITDSDSMWCKRFPVSVLVAAELNHSVMLLTKTHK